MKGQHAKNVTNSGGGGGIFPILPFEIICEIVSYLTSQSELYNAALVSRRYNIAATPLLYTYPALTSSNFDAFVATVAPTITPPLKKLPNDKELYLSDLVITLDLSKVLYSDTLRSSIQRLLSHCRNITTFIGSQKSFSGPAVRALRHSTKLTRLDLRPCNDSCDLIDFFHVLNFMPLLKVLHFPATSLFSSVAKLNGRWHPNPLIVDPNSWNTAALKATFNYPPNLTTLSVAGGIIDSTLISSGPPPTSITSFSASHLPFVRMTAVRQYINTLAPQLTHLSILHPIPRLPHNFLDRILISCPNLLHLTASVDFMTGHIFDEENCTEDHPLERIDLDCSGGIGSEYKISSDDISIALMEGRLKKLRVVRASVQLGWGKRGEEKKRVKDLAELLYMDRSKFGQGEDEDEDEDEESGYHVQNGNGSMTGRDDGGEDIDGIDGKLAGVWLF